MAVWVNVIRFYFFISKLKNEWPFEYAHSSFLFNDNILKFDFLN